MGNWDADEVIFFIFASIVSVAGTYDWYRPLLRISRFGRHGPQRFILAIAPIAPLAAVALVLTHWADPHYVVDHLDFQILFFVGAIAWLCLSALAAPLIGVHPRDDAIERNNTAAAVDIAALITAIGIIYAGSNIGAGPTIWTTIGPAAMGTLSLLALAFIVDLLAHPSDDIAIDHDLAAALRQGGFFLATALVLARAAAGDFHSWDVTIDQFITLGSPALLIAITAIAMHIAFRPTPTRPKPSPFALGVVPAVILVIAAVFYVLAVGAPEIGKHILTFEQYTHEQ